MGTLTPYEILLAALPFMYFHAISAVTPGPNNLMLAASGMNFGIRRTIPHMLGIVVGFGALIYISAFGLGAIVAAMPSLRLVLSIFSAAYILYLGYKIATSEGTNADPEKIGEPMTFTQAMLFQFINPKGLVAAIASVSLMPQLPIVLQCLVIFLVLIFICFPCVNIWAFFGTAMAKIFKTPRTRRIVNIVLAIMLVATIPMMML